MNQRRAPRMRLHARWWRTLQQLAKGILGLNLGKIVDCQP